MTMRAGISALNRPNGKTASLLNDPSALLSENGMDSSMCFISIIQQEDPAPQSMLKIGPAMQPVIAISPKPFLVMATSAERSPMQLPQANKVNPRRDFGRFVMIPRTAKRSTTILDVNATHYILIMNARIA